MFVKGLNHFLFSVSDLDKSIKFYQAVFNAKLLVKGRSTAYFDLNGMWLALNVEKDIPRNEIGQSYTHIAFSIEEAEFDHIFDKLKKLDVNILQIFRTGKPTVFRGGMKVRSNTEWYKKRRFVPLQVFEILFS